MTSSDFFPARLCGVLKALLIALVLIFPVDETLHAKDLMAPKAVELFKRMSEGLGKAETLQFRAYALYDDFE